ncbi:MAG TPA: twin-arginine translocase TatA/TatE family subunit [Mariprofundaceae bacterium]|nr:twin-arginine translocase TatA/TatE family subunit [Mariprofundaceae bacterium]
MGLGTTELILILVIVLVLFGAKKLPEIGGGLARGIKSFRKNISDEPSKDESEKEPDAAKDESKTS